MSCDLRIAYERPSAVSTAWGVVQWTYLPIGVVGSTMWRPCSDLIFHHATTQSEPDFQERPTSAEKTDNGKTIGWFRPEPPVVTDIRILAHPRLRIRM